MTKTWTKEELKKFLSEHDVKDGKSLEDAFAAHFGGLLQAILEEERDAKLGYTKYDWKNKKSENSRNGHSKKTVKSHFGSFELDIPRDTDGDFEPTIVKKHERVLSTKIQDMILSMCAKGMSTRDMRDHVLEIYGVEMSAEMISRITDEVMPLAKEWMNRPLEPFYPFVFLDGMMYGVVQDGVTVKKTVYNVYALTIEGKKDVLGIWIGDAESAKFWLKVMMDIRNRGVKDILLVSVDGLKGFEEAINTVFPKTEVQQCIVHQIRTCTRFVNYKDRKQFCADMREIYSAPNEEAGLVALDRFDEKWGKKYSYAVKSWRDNWSRLSTFFKYPEEIRRIMYTTNAIEGLNRKIRKVTKTKGAFPTDDSLVKLIYLVIIDASEKWTKPAHNWGFIINQLRAMYGERVDAYL